MLGLTKLRVLTLRTVIPDILTVEGSLFLDLRSYHRVICFRRFE
jgi:hypothetical protein